MVEPQTPSARRFYPPRRAADIRQLSIAKLGNVKTQTLRGFTAKDMDGILRKMV